MRIYQPNRVRPDAPQNQELEHLVREVVLHSEEEDLLMRFFGVPNIEAIPARITGRKLDPYEPPRDLVIVVFNQDQPVGYTDIAEDPPGSQTAEIALLVRTDMQRQGFGEAMFQTALEEMRKKGIRQLKCYLHLDNYKMKQALTKWSEKLHVRMRKEWKAGELLYVVEDEANGSTPHYLTSSILPFACFAANQNRPRDVAGHCLFRIGLANSVFVL